MGTLFALELAIEFPEHIPALFLLAVPLRPWMRLFGIRNMMRLVFDCIDQDNPMEVAVEKACGVAPTKKLWKYLGWTPRFAELLKEISIVERKLDNLSIPAMAYQSKYDELVCSISDDVLRKYPMISVQELNRSSHFYYHPSDLKRVQEDFFVQCQKITHD
jgi:esterase/lipase